MNIYCYIFIFNTSYYNVLPAQTVDEWLHAGFTPKAERQQTAVQWMSEFFKLCDNSPNSEFVKVNEDTKKDVFQRYQNEVRDLDADAELVDYIQFCALWSRVYPYCVKRTHCSIPGKCWICAKIDKLRRTAEDRLTLLRLKEAHMLHRGGMFMQERKRYVTLDASLFFVFIAACRYKERVEMALHSVKKGDNRVMSIIIDGMDQNNCKIPYLGSQDTFPAALKQVIYKMVNLKC